MVCSRMKLISHISESHMSTLRSKRVVGLTESSLRVWIPASVAKRRIGFQSQTARSRSAEVYKTFHAIGRQKRISSSISMDVIDYNHERIPRVYSTVETAQQQRWVLWFRESSICTLYDSMRSQRGRHLAGQINNHHGRYRQQKVLLRQETGGSGRASEACYLIL